MLKRPPNKKKTERSVYMLCASYEASTRFLAAERLQKSSRSFGVVVAKQLQPLLVSSLPRLPACITDRQSSVQKEHPSDKQTGNQERENSIQQEHRTQKGPLRARRQILYFKEPRNQVQFKSLLATGKHVYFFLRSTVH
ncbi:hypothetical protein NDU88_003035 [Pleurodeles waltl]|uniref:Uncharacterized protein n=1 Tax=Pleurodeles waltl TaxID=8319 RepID=A0AAV7Q8W3_PLEWA|nr:hypothetical protein NDU88_003035 [Pleurodeles waltl]